jgi:hypothetical protein
MYSSRIKRLVLFSLLIKILEEHKLCTQLLFFINCVMPRYLLRIFNNLCMEKIIPEKRITLIISILNSFVIKIIEQSRRDIIYRKIKNLFLVTIVNFWLQHFV